MKVINQFIKALSLTVITAVLFSILAYTASAQVSADANSCNDANYIPLFSPIYRQWNSSLIDHFYTNSATETATGYVSEKSFGSLINSQQPNTIPLYRYYSSSLSDHFYSTSAVTPPDYVSEGIVGYIFASPVPGSSPLYRSFRYIPGAMPNGDHLYTTSLAERDSAAQLGYTFESIEGYVCAVPQ